MSKKYPQHVTLIGMPTVGKTKVGKKLAKHLDCAFIDIDDQIVSESGARCLQEIVDTLSPEEFAKLEENVAIRTVVCLQDRTVIATGGSMVYWDRAMRFFRKCTRIIHLRAELETVERRLAKNPDRGIVFAPGETIKDLYRRRLPLYEKWAVDTISTDGKRSEVALELARKLQPLH